MIFSIVKLNEVGLQTGFYGIKMRKGCLECGCDAVGSFGFNCNTQTGQCSCKPGVSGQICDRCHLGYFNLSTVGCQRKSAVALSYLCLVNFVVKGFLNCLLLSFCCALFSLHWKTYIKFCVINCWH